MVPRLSAVLIPLAGLLACGGTTMRVAQDEANQGEAVSLAPAPATAPDSVRFDSSTTTPAPALEQPVEATQDTAQQPEQGYSAYGNGSSLEIRRIGQWSRTGVGESRRLVIRDANAWANFWSELGVGERPSIDFTRDVAIVVAAGQRPSGGYEITVDRVRQQNGELIVEVVETTPGPNCMTTGSLTQPADVVVVSSVNPKSWSFAERKEVRGCR
jgi:PrcB C-terminal